MEFERKWHWSLGMLTTFENELKLLSTWGVWSTSCSYGAQEPLLSKEKMIPKWDAKRKWWGLRSCFSLSHERRHRKIYNKTSLGTCRRRIHINSVCEMKESRNFKAAYRWLEKSFVWNLVQNKCSIGEMKVGESWKITFVNLALGEYLFEKNFKMITLVGLVCHNFLVN